MISLTENMLHQVTVLGTGLLAEARAGVVSVTGVKLLDAPEVELMDDGTITLRIAVPNTNASKPSPKGKAKAAPEG